MGKVEGRPLEETELVGRARDGDVEAYEDLVRMHQRVAMRTAWLVTRNAAEAEDAVQEAFVKAYRALHRFREGAAFRQWLLAIVTNEARNRRRSVARQDRLTLRVAEVRPSGDAAPSPETAVLEEDERVTLLEAVNRLREDDRMVLGYRYLLGLSEPEHGSDAAALELRAEPDGEGWRLTGTKAWISNAPDADVYSVFARTTPDAGANGVTAFAVPGDAPGLTGEPVELIAPHPVGRLEFDGVPVDESQMLGERDGGFRVAMRTLDLFRPSVGAFAVGMAQAALDLAVAHAGKRRSAGRLLREHQAVSQALGEMATRIEASRLLVHAAAAAHDRGEGSAKLSAMAKLFATETAQWVVDAAVQIHGARALEASHPLAHLYVDVRAPRIYEGTTEIQREIVARELFRPTAGG